MKPLSNLNVRAYSYEMGCVWYTVYQIHNDMNQFVCFQVKGFDIYQVSESEYYVWDSRSLEETHGFKTFNEALRFCVS